MPHPLAGAPAQARSASERALQLASSPCWRCGLVMLSLANASGWCLLAGAGAFPQGEDQRDEPSGEQESSQVRRGERKKARARKLMLSRPGWVVPGQPTLAV